MERLIFIFLILISSCKEVTKEQETETNEKAQSKFDLAASNFVVLTYQPEWHWTFENAKPTTLNDLELLEIKNILKKAINENNEKQKATLLKHNKNNPDFQIVETALSSLNKKYNLMELINKK